MRSLHSCARKAAIRGKWGQWFAWTNMRLVCTEVLRANDLRRQGLAQIFSDHGRLASSIAAPGWLRQISYQVQPPSGHHTAGHCIWRLGTEARNMASFGKPADSEDGRPKSQGSCLVGVWMPGSFIESDGEKQWGTNTQGHNREWEVVRK